MKGIRRARFKNPGQHNRLGSTPESYWAAIKHKAETKTEKPKVYKDEPMNLKDWDRYEFWTGEMLAPTLTRRACA